MNYLVAAYVLMCLIHSGYVWSLASRWRRLREELQQLENHEAKRV